MLRVTDLSDAHAARLQHCAPLFRHFGARRRFHGPITTVSCFEDNVLVREALEDAGTGTVLVVDGGGSRRCALLGDRLAGIAADRGVAGVIVHGCVRDTEELAALDVGVLALAAHPRRSVKRGLGRRDVPVAFADVLWTPGHHAYADPDGVVLSPVALDGDA